VLAAILKGLAASAKVLTAILNGLTAVPKGLAASAKVLRSRDPSDTVPKVLVAELPIADVLT